MTDTTLTQNPPVEEKTGTSLPTRNRIVIWYHGADSNLIWTLDQYLQLLYRRLGAQIDRSYFDYPRSMPQAPIKPSNATSYSTKTYENDLVRYEEEAKNYQEKHAAAVRTLERAVLFIPCLSNTFLTQFSMDIERDAVLRTSLENPEFQVMPLMIRPTEGMSSLSEPLCAHEGYHLEVVCQQIASMIENVLINSGNYKPVETPLTTLFSSSATIHVAIPAQHDPTMDLLRNALPPVKTLLEQVSTQVVEANQLALAERSQRLAIEHEVQREREALQASEVVLSRQVEEMRQQLTTLQAEQRMTIFARIRRWFQDPESETIS